MKKIVFRKAFRARFSEKLMELGNLVAVALVFGQFITDRPFSLPVFAIGIALTLLIYTFSYIIDI